MTAREDRDAVDVAAIRARHVEMSHWEKSDDGVLTYVVDGCAGCSNASPNGFRVEWPCDAITALDALAASEAARQEAEAALREIDFEAGVMTALLSAVTPAGKRAYTIRSTSSAALARLAQESGAHQDTASWRQTDE